MTITKNIYNTSQDERGYISVYEFTSSNGTIVMWDSESGYVNWTSIRKAMGWSKRGEGRNIMKEMENVEKTAKDIRKIRGGILKIQGTWIPFDDAYEAAKEYCYTIRYELTQIFGEQFAKEARPKAPSTAQPTKKRAKHQKHNHNTNVLATLKYNMNELTPPPSDIDSYLSSSASSSAVSTASNTPISFTKHSAASKYSTATTITGTTRKRRTSVSENGAPTERKRRRSHPKVNAAKSLANHHTMNSTLMKNPASMKGYNIPSVDPNNRKSSYNMNSQRQDWENICNNTNTPNGINNSNMGKKMHPVNLNIDTNQIFEAVETALALQTLSMDLGMRPFPSWMNIQRNEYKKCHDYPKLTYPSEFEMAGCRFEMVGGCYQKVC